MMIALMSLPQRLAQCRRAELSIKACLNTSHVPAVVAVLLIEIDAFVRFHQLHLYFFNSGI
jgi:hypothetical protein